MNNEQMMQLIKSPIMTEKASKLQLENNVYVFKVSRDADKPSIREAVEKLFKVTVKKVNTVMMRTKARRTKQYVKSAQRWKKAYVTLNEGDKIPLFSVE